MELGSLVTGGGAAGFLVAAAYAGKLILDWRRQRKEEPRSSASAAIADSATANATLIKTLEALREENVRMSAKILYLENEAAAKDAKIDDLEQRLNGIAAELAALRAHK